VKNSTERKELFKWKFLSILFLTAWIVIADISPTFTLHQMFFDVSPTATDRRIILHWTYHAFNHPNLESVTPSIEGWDKADISNRWAYVKQAYGAESLVFFRYTNHKDTLVYVSIMRTDSERKLAHGLAYCYGLQGYTSISKEIVNIEPVEDLSLPINLWFTQNPETMEGWMQAFYYVITYQKNTVDQAYFIEIQAHVPTPAIKDEARQAALEFAQEITLTLLTSLIIGPETLGEKDENHQTIAEH